MPSFPRGAQDKEEARWSPLPLPTTPGQGPAWAQCPGECAGLWQQLPAGPGARVSSPSPTGGDGSGSQCSQTARPCGRAPPPSRQRSAHPRATVHPLVSADILACSRQPLSGYISRASPASRHKHRATAEPDGLCQGRTTTWAPEAAVLLPAVLPRDGLQVPSRTLQRRSQQLEALQRHSLWDRDGTRKGNTRDELSGLQNSPLEP